MKIASQPNELCCNLAPQEPNRIGLGLWITQVSHLFKPPQAPSLPYKPKLQKLPLPPRKPTPPEKPKNSAEEFVYAQKLENYERALENYPEYMQAYREELKEYKGVLQPEDQKFDQS